MSFVHLYWAIYFDFMDEYVMWIITKLPFETQISVIKIVNDKYYRCSKTKNLDVSKSLKLDGSHLVLVVLKNEIVEFLAN